MFILLLRRLIAWLREKRNVQEEIFFIELIIIIIGEIRIKYVRKYIKQQ